MQKKRGGGGFTLQIIHPSVLISLFSTLILSCLPSVQCPCHQEPNLRCRAPPLDATFAHPACAPAQTHCGRVGRAVVGHQLALCRCNAGLERLSRVLVCDWWPQARHRATPVSSSNAFSCPSFLLLAFHFCVIEINLSIHIHGFPPRRVHANFGGTGREPASTSLRLWSFSRFLLSLCRKATPEEPEEGLWAFPRPYRCGASAPPGNAPHSASSRSCT